MNNIQNQPIQPIAPPVYPPLYPQQNLPKRLPQPQSLDTIPGVNISTIKAIDLAKFRNSTIPKKAYWLLLVPVIGWIALACIKIFYGVKHAQGEKILRESRYDSIEKLEDKIKILKKAIENRGPLTWQYQLELARVQLFNGDFAGAEATLKEVMKQRGSPSQTGWYNVKDKGLISFEMAKPENGMKYVDGYNVMKITYYTFEEAILHAHVQAANDQLDAAYDSYNQAIYYNDSLKGKIRPLQGALVQKMQESSSTLTKRALEILEAEKQFARRVREAKGS